MGITTNGGGLWEGITTNGGGLWESLLMEVNNGNHY